MIRWADLTTSEQRQFGNGCGPAWLPKWASKLLFSWFFGASCRRHDFGYARGGSRADKKAVDKGFYNAMKLDAARHTDDSAITELGLMSTAFIFYNLVRWFGWRSFNYGPYLTKEQILNRKQ